MRRHTYSSARHRDLASAEKIEPTSTTGKARALKKKCSVTQVRIDEFDRHSELASNRESAPYSPLDHQRHLQTVFAYSIFFSGSHFYRQIYRHLHLIPKISIQHLSARIADYRQPDPCNPSGSVGIYRYLSPATFFSSCDRSVSIATYW